MRRWSLRLLVIVAVLVIAAGAAWRWLTAAEAAPEVSDYEIPVAELRVLAESIPGDPPVSVRSELVSLTSMPRAAVFAGESFAPHPMTHQVFQIVWPDRFVLVDTAFPRETMAQMDRSGTFHDDRFDRVLGAMRSASRILITHEHFDHLAGAGRYQPPDGLAGRLQLTTRQLANDGALAEAKLPDAMVRSLTPLEYDRIAAIEPGVVLLAAPGHTPGSQLVFIRTQDGRELLLVGDVAWHEDQIRKLHYRPRLVTDFFLHEDRHAVLAQLRTLHDLAQTHPEISIVVSHDRDQRARWIGSGVLEDGLAP